MFTVLRWIPGLSGYDIGASSVYVWSAVSREGVQPGWMGKKEQGWYGHEVIWIRESGKILK